MTENTLSVKLTTTNGGKMSIEKIVICPDCNRSYGIRGLSSHRRKHELDAVTREPAICPECRDGKCRNCDGRAWDLATDDFATCECTHG